MGKILQKMIIRKEGHRMAMINCGTRKLLLAGAMGALLLILTSAIGSPLALAHDSGSATASAYLSHAPHGYATLKWSPDSKQLSVTLNLTGLDPHSTHPAHIHAGACTANGPIVYMLNNVVANNAGNATVTTIISNVQNGIPSKSWSINVHNGPGLSPANQFIPIACGNVHNHHTSSRCQQTVHVKLGATTGQNQSVWGYAHLKLKDGTLTVFVSVKNLVPGSVHAEHIHAGSCQDQVPGSVVYMLNNLVANSNGRATATTVIHGVHSIPEQGWYINVHRTTILTNQTGFDPIACGNVEN
jgi:hypothetical protein